MIENFTENIEVSDPELFKCPFCDNYDEGNFYVYDELELIWDELTDDEINDILSCDMKETLLKCKKCNKDFKVITNSIITYDYFIEENNENQKPLEDLDEFGHEIL